LQNSAEKIFSEFEKCGLDFFWPQKNLQKKIFAGQKFVISGTFENFSRDELKKKIADAGGKILSAISGNCDALICGKNPGSKRKKAENLQIKIWDEKKILQKFGENSAENKKNSPQNLQLF